jgi:hypothetical protein
MKMLETDHGTHDERGGGRQPGPLTRRCLRDLTLGWPSGVEK